MPLHIRLFIATLKDKTQVDDGKEKEILVIFSAPGWVFSHLIQVGCELSPLSVDDQPPTLLLLQTWYKSELSLSATCDRRNVWCKIKSFVNNSSISTPSTPLFAWRFCSSNPSMFILLVDGVKLQTVVIRFPVTNYFLPSSERSFLFYFSFSFFCLHCTLSSSNDINV